MLARSHAQIKSWLSPSALQSVPHKKEPTCSSTQAPGTSTQLSPLNSLKKYGKIHLFSSSTCILLWSTSQEYCGKEHSTIGKREVYLPHTYQSKKNIYAIKKEQERHD